MAVFIRGAGFGYIVVDGQKYRSDIVICNNEVHVRPKHLSSVYKDTYGHTPLSRREVEAILELCGKQEVAIVGTGFYGALPIMDDALDLLREAVREVVIEKTPKAIDYVNRFLDLGEKIIAIIHVTC